MNIQIKPREEHPDPEMVVWAGGSLRLATLFHGRGITTREEIEHLLNPLGQPEPDLTSYPPLLLGLERINAALGNGEKIAVYGDYDVDGITATAVLVTALSRLGAEAIWHIPNRFSEGYGMNQGRIRELAREGVSLIITCDCGISNQAEIALANELGMEVIVTDHHTPPEQLPDALSIINFKLLPQGHPSRDLPGVGTAFVLVRELLKPHGHEADDLLDLVALGIIADVVPLRGHGRQLFAMGLPVLKEAKRPGLAGLFAVARILPEIVDEEKLGFQIAPRINAAGRLGDGGVAVRLLLAREKEQATALARELDQLNNLRKELGKRIMEEITCEPGRPLVAYGAKWHQGVIGIAAGQFCSSNQAPAILMADSQEGEGIVGSARSVEGIDIYSVLQQCSGFLAKFGGHPAAAGFSLAAENLEGFMAAVQQVLDQAVRGWVPPQLRVDLVVKPEEVKLDLVAELNRLAPCGEGNPRPLLLCQGLILKSVRAVGSGHILTLGDRWHSFSAGLWNNRPAPEPGGSIGAVFSVSEDLFRGERSVWATLEAWWPGNEKPQLRAQGIEYKDMRSLSRSRVLKEYPGAGIFREGVEWQDYPGNTRNNLQSNPVLILLTPPASASILRQVLAMAGPDLVVLGYSWQERNFIADFLGVTKYILTQEAGVVSLSGLAAALGHSEETVLSAFRLLSVSGIIDFQLIDGKLVLQKLKGTKIKTGPIKDKLFRQVEETTAFQKWLQSVKIEEIIKIKI